MSGSVTINSTTITTGIVLPGDATLTNTAGGFITSTGIAVLGAYAALPDIVVNAGRIDSPTYGVALPSGGSVTNLSTGTITGGVRGVTLSGGGGTVSNAGLIDTTGTAGVALYLAGGGVVANAAGGRIGGHVRGIYARNQPTTITNAGTIAPSGIGGVGIGLSSGGVVTNQAGATISGGYFGIYLSGLASTVTNAGGITGAGLSGIAGTVDTTVTNSAGGTITGHYSGIGLNGGAITLVNSGRVTGLAGSVVTSNRGGMITNLAGGDLSSLAYGVVLSGSSGTVENAGAIVGTNNPGIYLNAGGSITNAAGGLIGGYGGAIDTNGSGTVSNAGTISSTGAFAVRLADGFADRLIIVPGASFTGLVNGGNTIGATAVSTLEFNAGTTVGTITGLGTQFVNFASLVIDAGANWQWTGTNTLSSGTGITNAGTFVVSGGTLAGGADLQNGGRVAVSSATAGINNLSGAGAIAIGSGSTLIVDGSATSSQAVRFAASTGLLRLGTPGSFASFIEGLGQGRTIDLPDTMTITAGSILAGNTLELAISGGVTLDFRLDPTQVFSGETVVFSGDRVSLSAPCFREGTAILTDRGPVPVESLRVGERVATVFGAVQRHAAIRWIGRRTIDCSRHPRPRDVWPVRILAGAFADRMPHRDLWLSPDHAVFVDDVLIPIRCLIDGDAIRQVPTDRVTYFHVELSQHDVLLAEGLACESFLDTGCRADFDNAGQVTRLHPELAIRTWDAQACAPLHQRGPAVQATRRRLAVRAPVLRRDSA